MLDSKYLKVNVEGKSIVKWDTPTLYGMGFSIMTLSGLFESNWKGV